MLLPEAPGWIVFGVARPDPRPSRPSRVSFYGPAFAAATTAAPKKKRRRNFVTGTNLSLRTHRISAWERGFQTEPPLDVSISLIDLCQSPKYYLWPPRDHNANQMDAIAD